jgi:hypothetical protein
VKGVVLGAVVVLSLGTTACGDSAVETQYQHVVERTTPPHQTVPRDVTLVRRDVALEATWDIQTDLNWEQYAEWVAQRLSGEYAATRIESRTMAFSKDVGGDRYAVTITATNSEPPLVLRLQLRLTPD